MANLLDDVMSYKALVMSGMPKLFNAEVFAEGEEEAVIEFIDSHGLPISKSTLLNYYNSLVGEVADKNDVINAVIEALKEGIGNVFSGIYGI